MRLFASGNGMEKGMAGHKRAKADKGEWKDMTGCERG